LQGKVIFDQSEKMFNNRSAIPSVMKASAQNIKICNTDCTA
jgi:hypothetical protein